MNSEVGRRMHRILLYVVVMLGVLGAGVWSPGTARAEPPDSDSKEAATKHYERGMKAFEAGDYEKAVSELRTVYTLRPDPIVLYNISLAEWRSGDLEAARIAAERAKREGLPDRAIPKTDGRIAGYRVIAQSKQRASDAAEVASSPAPDPAAPPGPDPKPAPEPQGLSARGWTGIASGAAGLGLLAGAFAIERSLASQLQPYRRSAREGDLEEYRDFQKNRLGELRRLQTTGRIFFAAGLAAASTGATLLIWDLSSNAGAPDRAARLRVMPTGAGLSVEF